MSNPQWPHNTRHESSQQFLYQFFSPDLAERRMLTYNYLLVQHTGQSVTDIWVIIWISFVGMRYSPGKYNFFIFYRSNCLSVSDCFSCYFHYEQTLKVFPVLAWSLWRLPMLVCWRIKVATFSNSSESTSPSPFRSNIRNAISKWRREAGVKRNIW
jgi:hypothetical protein